MAADTMDRKTFMAAFGTACACAAVGGMQAAFGEAPPAKPASPTPAAISNPGEKTLARAAKRMEFVDEWVRRFMHAVDDALDEPTRRRLMVANGRACFSAWAKDKPRRPEPASLETIAAMVARAGKDNGYSMEGNVIAFEYVGSAETGQASPAGVCLCPTVEAQTSKTISPTFCQCSVGYVQEMHERLFGRPVQVQLADSVLRGGQRCRFRITVT